MLIRILALHLILLWQCTIRYITLDHSLDLLDLGKEFWFYMKNFCILQSLQCRVIVIFLDTAKKHEADFRQKVAAAAKLICKVALRQFKSDQISGVWVPNISCVLESSQAPDALSSGQRRQVPTVPIVQQARFQGWGKSGSSTLFIHTDPFHTISCADSDVDSAGRHSQQGYACIWAACIFPGMATLIEASAATMGFTPVH